VNLLMHDFTEWQLEGNKVQIHFQRKL